jgi:hypothetical protein
MEHFVYKEWHLILLIMAGIIHGLPNNESWNLVAYKIFKKNTG